MKYLQLLASACNSSNDRKLAAILKMDDHLGRSSSSSSTTTSGGLYTKEFQSLKMNNINNIQQKMGQMLNDQSWLQFCMSYLQTKYAYLTLGDYNKAFKKMAETYSLFLKLFETPEESFWLIDTIQILSVNLRVLGKECDDHQPGEESPYIIVERLLKKGFQATVASRSLVKKQAAIGVVNNLLKVYFKNNAIRACGNTFKSFKKVFRSIDFDTLPLAQRVTYKFYEGRLAIFQEDYVLAEACFKFCLDECPKSEKGNRARILQYFIPVQIFFGKFPSAKLLKKYNLTQYMEIVPALMHGDIQNFEQNMKIHQSFFLKRGIFLLLEKLKTTLYRNLIFKIYNIKYKDKTNKINLKEILPTLQKIGGVDDMDGLECMISNLIYSGYIKGYISHEKSYLVLSKQNPYPKLSDIGDKKRK